VSIEPAETSPGKKGNAVENEEECCHLLPPGQCAYCSGSWRREQDAIAKEGAMIGAAAARKNEMRTGVTHKAGWTKGN
jgi:hypothetical protein